MAATHLAVFHFSVPPPPLLSSSSASTSSITAPPPSFSLLTPPSFAQQSQVRQPMQGMQGIGMIGALGTTSSVRLVVPALQFRTFQSTQRPQIIPSSQSPALQMLRASSLGSSASNSPSSVQGTQTQNRLDCYLEPKENLLYHPPPFDLKQPLYHFSKDLT